MAKHNVGLLLGRIAFYEEEVARLRVIEREYHTLNFLRRVENLNQDNVELFLAQQVNNIFVEGQEFYFPIATGLKDKGRGVGKFARQWG